MKLAIGIILSSGYKADTDFVFGRAHAKGDQVDVVSEGLFALTSRINSGEANRVLPAHLRITEMRTIISRKFPTDVARNEICAGALRYGADALLFLDADMVHPVDLLERLLAHDKPVITSRYHLKKAPFASVAYVKHRTQTGPHRYASVHFGKGVFEIERGGAGALLIRRDVLAGIQAMQHDRWAVVLDGLRHATPAAVDLLDLPPEPVCQWFKYQRGPEAPYDLTTSEDFWFYQQAREAGFKCYVDWDIDVPHLGLQAIDGSWNTPFLNTQVSEYENPEARDLVLNNTIVCGYAEGMVLNDDARVPAYVVTEGER